MTFGGKGLHSFHHHTVKTHSASEAGTASIYSLWNTVGFSYGMTDSVQNVINNYDHTSSSKIL
jgi:hypothetical protein